MEMEIENEMEQSKCKSALWLLEKLNNSLNEFGSNERVRRHYFREKVLLKFDGLFSMDRDLEEEPLSQEDKNNVIKILNSVKKEVKRLYPIDEAPEYIG